MISQDAFAVLRDLLPVVTFGPAFALAGLAGWQGAKGSPRSAIVCLAAGLVLISAFAVTEGYASRLKGRCFIYHECPAGWDPNFVY